MKTDRIESIMTGMGFSPYESRAYITLVGENPLTGYELSGRSGIPRSKVYECIERLKRKRLILPVEGNPIRYVPVPPSELVRRLSGEFETSMRTLATLLSEGTQTDGVDYIFNISGYEEILGKASVMMQEADLRLDLSLWDLEINGLQQDIASAMFRGVHVRLISFGDSPFENAEIYRHRPLLDGEFNGRWITVIKDQSEVLTGECSDEKESIAAWTRNRSLVFTSLKYIEHEIIRIREKGKN